MYILDKLLRMYILNGVTIEQTACVYEETARKSLGLFSCQGFFRKRKYLSF